MKLINCVTPGLSTAYKPGLPILTARACSQDTTGERVLTVRSTDNAASLNVISGGDANAGLVVSSPNGWDSWLTLAEQDGSAFHLVNDGVEDQLYIADDDQKLLMIQVPHTLNHHPHPYVILCMSP